MRLIAMGFAAVLMTGCAVPLSHDVSDRYATVAPVPADAAQVGLWTSIDGANPMSLRIDKDGRGLSCRSVGSDGAVNILKLANSTLYFQDGTTMPIRLEGDKLVGHPTHESAAVTRFARDTGLQAVSPACKQKMTGAYL